jgi:hypothetical protein
MVVSREEVRRRHARVLNVGTLAVPYKSRICAASGSLYGAWFGQNWTVNGIATYAGLSTDITHVV